MFLLKHCSTICREVTLLRVMNNDCILYNKVVRVHSLRNVQQILSKKMSQQKFPNWVLVVIESWSRVVIASLGSLNQVTSRLVVWSSRGKSTKRASEQAMVEARPKRNKHTNKEKRIGLPVDQAL